MKHINEMEEDNNIRDGIYLCKTKTYATSKNGKEYIDLNLQDKTGSINAKIWDTTNPGIRDFEALDYIKIKGSVKTFNGALQVSIVSTEVVDPKELNEEDFYPASKKNKEEMINELNKFTGSVKNTYLSMLLGSFFGDEEFLEAFSKHSAAKALHHGFIGGLMEHSLNVAYICAGVANRYAFINRDLLVTAALLHDIGKLRELSDFPMNDYTDEGQLLGHVVMGMMMVDEHIHKIEGFPPGLATELKHLILSHHGELEYGSPKKPALPEAVILSFADNMDAKVETMYEALVNNKSTERGGFVKNKIADNFVSSYIRESGKES